MTRQQITRRRGLLAAAVGTALLLVVAPAQAWGGQPGASGVSQYVETVPSASSVGQYVEAVPTGTGSSTPRARAEAPLTRGDQTQAIRRALAVIAKSSSYGAPDPRRTPIDDAAQNRLPDPAETSVGLSLRSALGALGTASDARLFGLLVVVLVTTVVAIGLATRPSRS